MRVNPISGRYVGPTFPIRSDRIQRNFQIKGRELPTSAQIQQGVYSADEDSAALTRTQILELIEALEGVERLLQLAKYRGVAAPEAAGTTSSPSLGLLTIPTAAELISTEEVNTTPTSFSTHGPDWTGSSTLSTIGGTYDGSSGTGTLTFKATRGGTHGSNDLQIKVYDPLMSEIERITIRKSHPIDRVYTLSNNLTLQLSAGDLLKNDTFTVDVVADPTSYTPSDPSWTGSTGIATVDGVYDGSEGAGTLTFDVTAGGTHGTDDLTVKVYDPGMSQTDAISILATDPIDQEYTLSSGLVVTFAAGDLLKEDTFTVDVSDTQGSAVDPDKPLTGTRGDDPDLEYGYEVTAGTFQVNGETIQVNAGDTLNEVVDKITASAAEVTAAYDPVTETVTLTHDTPGPAGTITVESDTSGFVAATKLEGAVTTPGRDPEPDEELSDVDQFSTVTSGTITVNGVDIVIDADTDSLNDVIDLINASVEGVTVSLDSGGEYVSLVADDIDADIVLSSGSTGFFPALEISDGTYYPSPGSRRKGVSDPEAYEISEAVRDAADAMNTLYDNSNLGTMSYEFISELRGDIQTAIAQYFGDEDEEETQYISDVGIDFNFQNGLEGVFNYSRTKEGQFIHSLRQQIAQVEDLFLGPEAQDGFIENLIEVLRQAESDLSGELGSVGQFVDVMA